MTGYLTANGKSSEDFSVILTDAAVYGRAERDIEFVSVPGRSGDLFVDNGRYRNVNYTYPCIILGDFDINLAAFIGYLESQGGYIRMEDTFHPDEYVMARYTGQLDPKKVHRDSAGVFEIAFNRKPQRWLKEGERAIPFTGNGLLINTGYATALPLVRVYGTGEVGIGEHTITITASDEYTDIDCDLQDAFKGTVNCNGNIRLNSGAFWGLRPGENGVSLGSGISRVEITPRWYRL